MYFNALTFLFLGLISWLPSAQLLSRPSLSCKKPTKIITRPKRFAQTLSKIFAEDDYKTPELYLEWTTKTSMPFNELIISWNALRPEKGTITFYVSLYHHNHWSAWHRIATWQADSQATYTNVKNRYIHTKYVRTEVQKGIFASGFRIKALFSQGASKNSLHALFGCASNMNHFKTEPSLQLDKSCILVKHVPCQSQMILDHPRARDLCAPTSLSIMARYFIKKYCHTKPQTSLHDFAVSFADKVYDHGTHNIYGNWLLNSAQAYEAAGQKVFFSVQRLNNFHELYAHLEQSMPVAVSVRRLKGGATSYANGHIMVVVGWDKKKQRVLCVDPAFEHNHATLKSYRIKDFLKAWGLSKNLAYVPLNKQT